MKNEIVNDFEFLFLGYAVSMRYAYPQERFLKNGRESSRDKDRYKDRDRDDAAQWHQQQQQK